MKTSGDGWRGIARRSATALVVTAIGVAAGLVVVGDYRGLIGGAVIGAASSAWVSRQPTAMQRRQVRLLAADLPFAIDLVAAALRAGAPAGTAAVLAAEAVGGPVGDRLAVVGRALRLGAPPMEAWAQLAPSATRAAGDDPAHRVARAAQRSGHSGAALAAALTRVADDLRSDAVIALEGRARTAGVLVVLPLGLCFLPAFVLTGLVPVVVAIVADMLIRIS